MKKYLERVKKQELTSKEAAILYAVGVPFTLIQGEEVKVIKKDEPFPGCIKVITEYKTFYKARVVEKKMSVFSTEEAVLSRVRVEDLNKVQKEKYNEFLKKCEV